MRRFFSGILGVMLLAGSAAVVRADSIFNFDNIAAGTPTPFFDTNNGVTATFTGSISDGFIVQSANQFQGFVGGNNLYQQDPPYTFITLRIGFSGPQASTAFNFALNGTSNATLTLTPFLAGSAVGSPFTVGSSLSSDGVYSLGSLAFNPGLDFDSFELSSNVEAIALDDLSVSPAEVSGVPEPAPVALLLFGMAGMLGLVRHRQQRAAAVRYPRF
jgi:hypothetical protein